MLRILSILLFLPKNGQSSRASRLHLIKTPLGLSTGCGGLKHKQKKTILFHIIHSILTVYYC